LTRIVHSAPNPSPLIGTLRYVEFAVPIPIPLSVRITVLMEPSTALFLTAAFSVEDSQDCGTEIKSKDSNFTTS
jgi:hypothetical protein